MNPRVSDQEQTLRIQNGGLQSFFSSAELTLISTDLPDGPDQGLSSVSTISAA